MIRSILVALFIALCLVSPASAHKLKVFAAVEGDTVSGYAFFIGGGRAQDTDWTVKNAAGEVIGTGKTNTEGEFGFTVPQSVSSDITITVNTQEGHIASKTLAVTRFSAVTDSAAADVPAAAEAATDSPAAAVAAEPSLFERQMQALVETAVQRQVEPLLERIEEMDSRLRYTDILSGLFLIAGLAGIGLWAFGRRK